MTPPTLPGVAASLLPDLFAVEGVAVPTWALLLVVVGFPAVDVAMFRYSGSYRRLFSERDADAFNAAYVRMGALRWVNLAAVLAVLAYADVPLSAVGLVTPAPWLAAASAVGLLAVGVAYAVVVLGSDPVPADALSPGLLTSLPKDRGERVLWFLHAGVTAGVTEELIYRGFAIAALVGAGLPVWAAVLVASLSFVFAHGTITYHYPPLFPVYLGIGVALSLLYLAVGSLLPMVVVHLAWNMVQTIGSYAGGFEDAAGDPDAETG